MIEWMSWGRVSPNQKQWAIHRLALRRRRRIR